MKKGLANASTISTHTLTWSVTSFLVVNEDFTEISTHTLTWSVTSACSAVDIAILYFNSHAHVERDEYKNIAPLEKVISTHTLTWSVTADEELKSTITTFQLTRSRGA